ncbi:hypothetical protein GCM10023183_05890 [Nibribacter koreensis]|uniref:Uncharacterized protein n=1 Tax=Nibribacter koreensis TaxID=1084519 RepID=A0ABP8F8V8_9BACT
MQEVKREAAKSAMKNKALDIRFDEILMEVYMVLPLETIYLLIRSPKVSDKLSIQSLS